MQFVGQAEEEVVDGHSISLQTFSLPLTDGVRLSGQRWTTSKQDVDANQFPGSCSVQNEFSTPNEPCSGEPSAQSQPRLRILCIHGLLDNCRSFYAMAPRLLAGWASSSRTPVELVALDLPGHGKSSHLSLDLPPIAIMSNLTFFVAQAVRALEWDVTESDSRGFVLMGHSMGAMVSTMLTAAFPEHVSQLILLDGFGPELEQPHLVSDRLREHIEQRYKVNTNMQQQQQQQQQVGDASMPPSSTIFAHARKQPRLYPTLDDAVTVRQRTAKKSPGDQWLSRPAAYEMVIWAIKEVELPDNSRNGSIQRGWQFQHDPRFHLPQLQSHTLLQAVNYWERIRDAGVQTLWLRAVHGWPFHNKWMDRAEEAMGDCVTIKTLEGSHHFHADPETVDNVTNEILMHIQKLLTKNGV